MIEQHPCTCGLQATCMCDPKRVLNTGYLSITHNEVVTLRDQLAMAALSGINANPTWDPNGWSDRAKAAYEAADAMLEARKK